MPKLKVTEDERAQRLRQRAERETIFHHGDPGLLDHLNDKEIEAVLGHELTHIRNGDVRMLVIAVIIAGVIGFFAELLFRMMFQGGWRWGGGRSSSSDSDRGKGGGGAAIVIAIALVAVAWLLSVVIRFALSRKREYLADAGSVELTKDPGRHDLGAAQDRRPRRTGRRNLRGHGDVHRQPPRGLRRSVRHPSFDRKPDRGAGSVRRRPRSRPARPAGEPTTDRRNRRAGQQEPARRAWSSDAPLPKPFLPTEPPSHWAAGSRPATPAHGVRARQG